eukprot:2600886-Pleurochrysis_carterae.AAC.1
MTEATTEAAAMEAAAKTERVMVAEVKEGTKMEVAVKAAAAAMEVGRTAAAVMEAAAMGAAATRAEAKVQPHPVEFPELSGDSEASDSITTEVAVEAGKVALQAVALLVVATSSVVVLETNEGSSEDKEGLRTAATEASATGTGTAATKAEAMEAVV